MDGELELEKKQGNMTFLQGTNSKGVGGLQGCNRESEGRSEVNLM